MWIGYRLEKHQRAVREAGVSRHHGGPDTPRTITALSYWGDKVVLIWAPIILYEHIYSLSENGYNLFQSWAKNWYIFHTTWPAWMGTFYWMHLLQNRNPSRKMSKHIHNCSCLRSIHVHFVKSLLNLIHVYSSIWNGVITRFFCMFYTRATEHFLDFNLSIDFSFMKLENILSV